MKALVLSVVFALTSVVNAVSGNNVKDFAYNSEKQESGVETQTVYKVKEGKYLERHLQYNYTHDEKGRVSRQGNSEMEPGQQPLRKTVLPQLQLHRQRSKRGICSMEQQSRRLHKCES